MKKLFKILMVCGLVVSATSCNKYLDINANPNDPTAATPDLILPQAIVSFAAYHVQFNSFAGYANGMTANGGGYGAFGAQTTYNYATTDYTNLFSNSYDNINDLQYIVDKTSADGKDRYFNAAARIMRAFAYQRLVDIYGDVPYTEAVKGAANIAPKYDKAEDIYTDLFAQLNTAIESIDMSTAEVPTPIKTASAGSVDVLFGGDMQLWKRFANTIKLRMLIRIQDVTSMASVISAEKAKLAGAAFITKDAIVQPGYQAGNAGKQNPMWNTWAYNETGSPSAAGIQQVPTAFAVGFYDGKKISDPARGAVTYKSLTTYTGQLGSSTNPNAPNGSAWYIGTATGTSGDAVGILKGPSMGQPIMLAAESYFLQAEANLVGLVGSPATAQDNFNEGIRASFRYLYKDKSNAYSGSYSESKANDDANAYISANSKNYLVRYTTVTDIVNNTTTPTTEAQKLEAIITQKYIALNQIDANEAFNEYRRTGYPKSNPTGDPAHNAASTISVSTAPDKLPVRIQYPSSEYALNSANVPPAVNNFTSKLFWDLN
ncbi:SusD/RagB family nutrient-binding outer membrane lipoprotein [Mucilaginibacter sp. AK015]|uniref:SusD/RagB family nutrient-binding outer membrane lipoprotein n=1 Tax=Mucilaginibacter sp. AK015 TaxID=2723072 RepID=UPI00160808D3|nr:SusD/RagB family nutrient-binding outer membrane lipoprotein [Mucilaginibacter sp. AK015]MBB5397425.1 hypothetical protein [Mucilaginibacter sp. AK015]